MNNEEDISKLITKISTMLLRERTNLLKEIGITSQQYSLLQAISTLTKNSQNVFMSQVIEELGLQKSALTRIVSRANEEGLIEKDDTGFKVYLSLTTDGKNKKNKADKIIDRFNQNIFSSLTMNQKRQLEEYLKKIK